MPWVANPVKIFSSVLLPEPEGPMTTDSCLSRNSPLIPLRMTLSAANIKKLFVPTTHDFWRLRTFVKHATLYFILQLLKLHIDSLRHRTSSSGTCYQLWTLANEFLSEYFTGDPKYNLRLAFTSARQKLNTKISKINREKHLGSRERQQQFGENVNFLSISVLLYAGARYFSNAMLDRTPRDLRISNFCVHRLAKHTCEAVCSRNFAIIFVHDKI